MTGFYVTFNSGKVGSDVTVIVTQLSWAWGVPGRETELQEKQLFYKFNVTCHLSGLHILRSDRRMNSPHFKDSPERLPGPWSL